MKILITIIFVSLFASASYAGKSLLLFGFGDSAGNGAAGGCTSGILDYTDSCNTVYYVGIIQ